MSWRWDCKWEGERTFVCMQGKTQRWGFKMEHSWTAQPTCDRILYYYGDFSVALCFAPTVKTEQKEIEKQGYHKLRENSEQKEQSCYFFKHWDASGSKCALFQKELEISCFHPLQEVYASHYILKFQEFFCFTPWKTKWPKITQLQKQKLLSLWREFYIKTSKRHRCDAPSHLLQSEVKTKVLMHKITTESWIERNFWVISAFAYRFWVLYWYPCQRRSACDLATPVRAPSGLLKTMSACGGEESWTPASGTGPGAHFGHCCGWSFVRRGDSPGYRWRGILARHHSLRHPSPQDQAERSGERNILWKRCKGQRQGREGASLLAHSPRGWPHTPRGLPGSRLER